MRAAIVRRARCAQAGALFIPKFYASLALHLPAFSMDGGLDASSGG
jgi:hypothetical protein